MMIPTLVLIGAIVLGVIALWAAIWCALADDMDLPHDYPGDVQ